MAAAAETESASTAASEAATYLLVMRFILCKFYRADGAPSMKRCVHRLVPGSDIKLRCAVAR
jgi:hypothetical protein